MNLKCEFKINNKRCYFVGDKIHKGTEDKLNMIEKYVEAWIHKIFNSKMRYNRIIFLDAMANSGYYQNKSNMDIKGTSVRVANLFNKYSNSKYKNNKFELILNDKNEQAIKCQKCHMSGINSKIKISYYTYDISKFLDKIVCELRSINNVHLLFFYDPFKADIHWNEVIKLVHYFKNNPYRNIGVDFVFTHFHQHDTLRGLKEAKKPETIERYERTYEKKIDIILSEIDKKETTEINEYFRNRIVELLKNKLRVDETKIAYAPIFNRNNAAIYDIVFFSMNEKAKNLFKYQMYIQGKSLYTPNPQYSLYIPSENTYSDKRKDYKEKDLFYSPYCYASEIFKYFENSNISKDEFKKYLSNHLYIPLDGALRDINKALVEYFSVKLPEKGKDYYEFPEQPAVIQK